MSFEEAATLGVAIMTVVRNLTRSDVDLGEITYLSRVGPNIKSRA